MRVTYEQKTKHHELPPVHRENLKWWVDGTPGWLSRLSIRLQLRPWSHFIAREFEPRIGLCADSLEPGACFGFCLLISLPFPCSRSVLCVSQKWINVKNFFFFNFPFFDKGLCEMLLDNVYAMPFIRGFWFLSLSNNFYHPWRYRWTTTFELPKGLF